MNCRRLKSSEAVEVCGFWERTGGGMNREEGSGLRSLVVSFIVSVYCIPNVVILSYGRQ